MKYAASIKPSNCKRNGRGAIEVFLAQHAGQDKLIKILQEAKTCVNTAKWSGLSNVTLQSHAERSRAYYVDIEVAIEHVPEQIPNQQTRVQALLDSIKDYTDPKYQTGTCRW